MSKEKHINIYAIIFIYNQIAYKGHIKVNISKAGRFVYEDVWSYDDSLTKDSLSIQNR